MGGRLEKVKIKPSQPAGAGARLSLATSWDFANKTQEINFPRVARWVAGWVAGSVGESGNKAIAVNWSCSWADLAIKPPQLCLAQLSYLGAYN